VEQLSKKEIINLVKSVFPHYNLDKKLGILVDIPNNKNDDNENWKIRRDICTKWNNILKDEVKNLNLEEISLIAYHAVGANNADLPDSGYIIKESLPETSDLLDVNGKISFEDIFKTFQLFLAPTENSATAPLKNAAKKYGFRAATMPGFSPKMIPALRIDYEEVNRRVAIIKEKLDPAISAKVIFRVNNKENFNMYFDLRFRKGHLSPGRFPDKSTAGNLPSGETYIVPYEGELSDKSKTEGTLPVQIENEIVYFTIKENIAVSVTGKGPEAEREADHLLREPAYGNMAELGFGVLGDFGLEPINEILLDEKLGFHVAFGRSDHFGGAVGPKDFSKPEEVIHLDRIYIPKTQPDIIVKSLVLEYENKESKEIIKEGRYLIFD
jgi:hypothetical protein